MLYRAVPLLLLLLLMMMDNDFRPRHVVAEAVVVRPLATQHLLLLPLPGTSQTRGHLVLLLLLHEAVQQREHLSSSGPE